MFRFFTLPLKIPNETKLHLETQQNCVTLLFRLKTKTLGEISHDYFLVTPGNSMLFLINPWKFHLLSLQCLWKFLILNPPVWFFSGIALYKKESIYTAELFTLLFLYTKELYILSYSLILLKSRVYI